MPGESAIAYTDRDRTNRCSTVRRAGRPATHGRACLSADRRRRGNRLQGQLAGRAIRPGLTKHHWPPEALSCGGTAETQACIVRDAIQAAKAAGLALPQFEIYWRDGGGRDGISLGMAEFTADGQSAMYLSINTAPDDLPRLAWHELKHLSDYHAGHKFTPDSPSGGRSNSGPHDGAAVMWRWLRRLFSRRLKPAPSGWTQLDKNGHAFVWLDDDPDARHWDWARHDPREDSAKRGRATGGRRSRRWEDRY